MYPLWWFRDSRVFMCVIDWNFVEQQEPLDGPAAMSDGHAAVVAEEVADL